MERRKNKKKVEKHISHLTQLTPKKQMVIRVYLFLRDEYRFIKLHNYDNCKLTPLAPLIIRTAQATGLTSGYVSRIVTPYKNADFMPSLPSSSQSSQTSDNDHQKSNNSTFIEVNVKNELITDTSGEPLAEEKDDLGSETILGFIGTIKEEPDVEQEIPINQDTLVIKKETPDTELEISGIMQEIPIIKQELLDIEYEENDEQEEVSEEISEQNNEEIDEEIDFENKIMKKTILKILTPHKNETDTTDPSAAGEIMYCVEFKKKRKC